MGYIGRRTSTTDDPLELYEREKARAVHKGAARVLKKAATKGLKGQGHAVHKGGSAARPARTRELTWLDTAFRVHDPLAVQRILCKALEQRPYCVEWNPRRPQKRRLQAVWWQKRTKAREAEARAEARATGRPFLAVIDDFCGRSLCAELDRAAKDFGLSLTTLRRLVRGEAKSLSWIFAERLRKRLLPEEWAKLEAALLSPTARKLLDGYVDYIAGEIKRYTTQPPRHQFRLSLTTMERREVTEFERKAKLLGAPATRARLASLRVWDAIVRWEPLCANLLANDAAAVNSRERFVKAGFGRELAILRAEMRLFRGAALAPVGRGPSARKGREGAARANPMLITDQDWLRASRSREFGEKSFYNALPPEARKKARREVAACRARNRKKVGRSESFSVD
ncbi:MAG: hypothetical protein WEA80_13060 [Gemmatimonadaceae bacterium]